MNYGVARKLAVLVLAVSGLVVGYWLLDRFGIIAGLADLENPHSTVAALGAWGPAAIVGLMMAAVVFSPLPSAPVALAAGALYDHAWGTLYVVLGAESGALLAFAIARICGRDLVERWARGRLPEILLWNQNGLMWLVFVSRLLPFVSFDLVSYAAGLTALSFWRFSLSTLAGIVPASFMLAHFGSEMSGLNPGYATAIVVLLGAATAPPLVYRAWRHR